MRKVFDFKTGQVTVDNDFVKPDWNPTKADKRPDAVVSRTDFCLALKRMGILPRAEAIAAARGEWPATFATFMAGMDQDVAAEVEIRWGAAQVIHYADPTLQALAMVVANGDQAQATALLDQIFGV